MIFGLSLGVSIGVAEHFVGGDLKTAQNILREKLALPAIVVISLAMIGFVFAYLNIIAKRARDVGLPGWVTAIVIAALSGGASYLSQGITTAGTGVILLVILALLPSALIKR